MAHIVLSSIVKRVVLVSLLLCTVVSLHACGIAMGWINRGDDASLQANIDHLPQKRGATFRQEVIA